MAASSYLFEMECKYYSSSLKGIKCALLFSAEVFFSGLDSKHVPSGSKPDLRTRVHTQHITSRIGWSLSTHLMLHSMSSAVMNRLQLTVDGGAFNLNWENVDLLCVNQPSGVFSEQSISQVIERVLLTGYPAECEHIDSYTSPYFAQFIFPVYGCRIACRYGFI